MRKLAILLSTAVALSGCYETAIYTTDHPSESQVSVEVTIPTDQSSGDAVAESLTIIFNGEEYTTDENGSFDPGLLDPGTYTYYTYNDPATESGDDSKSTITYDSATDMVIASVPTVDSDGNLATDPDQLYFAQSTITLTEDTQNISSTEMEQLIGQLDFRLALDGEAISRLTEINVELNGVAQQWDCVANVPYGSSATVQPELSLSSNASAGMTRSDEVLYYLEGTVSILGVVTDDEQILTVALSYDDDNPGSHTYQSNISEQLADFNDDKSTSTTLENTVATPTETNPSGSIGDWTTTNYSVEAK